jgi:hypothetical protein
MFDQLKKGRVLFKISFQFVSFELTQEVHSQ